MLWLDRDLKIFYEISKFSDNTKDDKSDISYKVRSLINHFNQSFSNFVSNDNSQSIDGHMVKFKG